MRTRLVLSIIIFSTVLLMYCTKKDQVVAIASTTTNELISFKTKTAPVIDGTVDAVWANATKLQITPTVPDPGNGLFTGYNGQQYPATIRSMYDDNNIYFLLEYADATQSVNVAPWYFNPSANVSGKTGWQKEPTSKTFDANGAITRDGWGEDKFAMLWNIDFSTPKFITQTCYASCHVFTPYLDYSQSPAVYTSNANNGNHYTNGASEKIDMWWGRLGYISKDASLNFVDDNYQDWAGGPAITSLVGGNANGRHVDDIYPNGTASTTWPYRPNYTTSPTQGEVSNSQNLKLDGTGASVAVPIWVIPNSASAGFILVADTVSGGRAKKVTGVSSAGVLTLSDGSTIDPTSGTDYQRTGDPVTGATAAKSIPSYIAVPLIGGRADITGSAVYTGTGWTVEYKRALKTGDLLKQDIDFSSLQDQQFGVAIWNKSNNQHGINPNLLLHFQK
ncbi:MAG: hypothetical protein JSU05_04090 [Bacteroidetes bacterium]|nr:hypothetical protein [Bacteroidota bacterium]